MSVPVWMLKLAVDLNRCQHGRLLGESCAGFDPGRPRSGCRGGTSLGNPWLPPGRPIGYDRRGLVYVMPAQPQTCAVEQAWRTSDGELPPGWSHPDDDPGLR